MAQLNLGVRQKDTTYRSYMSRMCCATILYLCYCRETIDIYATVPCRLSTTFNISFICGRQSFTFDRLNPFPSMQSTSVACH